MRLHTVHLGAAVLALSALLSGCERPPIDTVQRGYRGTAMVEVYNPRTLAIQAPGNQPPAMTPATAGAADGPKSGQVYQNVKVLGDTGVAEFTQLMVSMTAWVSPKEGCTYCHAAENFASDAKYTKVVARRMLEMTRHINSDWKTHVAGTGVTCYTCHRGEPVPAKVWFKPEPQRQAKGMVGSNAGQNSPATTVGLTSLPYDPFTPYLLQANPIRTAGVTALQVGNRQSTKQTEFTYGLMVHMSDSLGVNCTYCHNTRSFSSWDQSTPQRGTAWHGINMTRDLNVNYLVPLTSTFPEGRHGPTGDVAKVNCATCHQGAFKPLYGAKMLTNNEALTGFKTVAANAANGLPATIATAEGATVFFGLGSSAIAGDAVAAMKLLIDNLNANPAVKVSISGYHSATGDLTQNQELAKNRAIAVRDSLRSAGLAEGRFELQKPLSAEANLSGEDPGSRRVEVLVKK